MSVNITIGQGQGITQAIKAKALADGVNISNKVNASVWGQVMNEVKTANSAQAEGQKFYSGGEDAEKLNNRANWKTDFKVVTGQVISLAQDVWNKIVALLTGETPKPKTQPDVQKPTIQTNSPAVTQTSVQVSNANDTTLLSSNTVTDPVETITGNDKTIVRTNSDGTTTRSIDYGNDGDIDLEYLLNADGQEISRTEYGYNKEKGLVSADIYKNNSDGTRSEVRISSRNGVEEHREEFVFDKDGNNIEYVEYGLNNELIRRSQTTFCSEPELKGMEKSVLIYDANNQPVSKIEYIYAKGADGKYSRTEKETILRQSGTVVTAQPVQTAPITNSPPLYYSGETTVTAQPPIQPPVTGPKEGENPAYDAMVRGSTTPVKNTNEPDHLTQEDIDNAIKNLKPGESYRYTHKESLKWANGSSYEELPITWKREADSTLTKTTRKFVGFGRSAKVVNLSEHYSSDGKELLSKDVVGALPFARNLKSFESYNNGKLVTRTTDLTNLDDKTNLVGPASMLLQYVNALGLKNRCESQEFKDKDGKTIISFKDGNFYNAKGKKIDMDKAWKILDKSNDKGKLASLIQNYE